MTNTNFRKLSKRLQNIVISHMMYYQEVEGQMFTDYRKNGDEYIANFMLDESSIWKFCPRSYTKRKRKETHDEIIKQILGHKISKNTTTQECKDCCNEKEYKEQMEQMGI